MGNGPKVDCSQDTPITQQSQKNDTDINQIVKRAKQGKDISHLVKQGVYLDLVNMPDYREALNIVATAQNAFMELDASIRERFSNDPYKLIQFLSDNNNREEAIKLGLVQKPAAQPAPSKEKPLPAEGAKEPNPAN